MRPLSISSPSVAATAEAPGATAAVEAEAAAAVAAEATADDAATAPAVAAASTVEADDAAAASAWARAAVEDAALVARFRAGDTRAFDALVRRYQRPLFYLALRYLGHEADAQDVTQRALVQAFERLAALKRDGAFGTWVYSIAVHLALNVRRDRPRAAPLEAAPEAAAPAPADDASSDGAETRARLRAAVARLPPQQRLVVELRVFEELPFRAVAEIAGCSEGAAKVSFHHAVKRLRALVNGDHDGSGSEEP